MSRQDVSAGWSDEDWRDAREDLAPLSDSEPQPGSPIQAERWNWFGEGRPAAWRAFGE